MQKYKECKCGLLYNHVSSIVDYKCDKCYLSLKSKQEKHDKEHHRKTDVKLNKMSGTDWALDIDINELEG